MEPEEKGISVSRQCELLDVPRSSHYEGACKKDAKTETEFNLELMVEIDQVYTESPFYGSRRIAKELCRRGHDVNRKRIQRLMRIMGIMGVAPGPMSSTPHPEAKRWPYLLTGVKVERPNQVWSTDITYIPMGKHGFMYLVAVVDWYSRKLLSWELSNSMDGSFCVKALLKALYAYGKPEIFNTDQGSQFTSSAFTGVLEQAGIKISMDGRGRAMDNIFIERFWRNVKYEDIYLHGYSNPVELRRGLEKYFDFYNNRRLHQSLDYMTPSEAYAMNSAITGGATGGLLRRYDPPVAKSSACELHLNLLESCP